MLTWSAQRCLYVNLCINSTTYNRLILCLLLVGCFELPTSTDAVVHFQQVMMSTVTGSLVYSFEQLCTSSDAVVYPYRCCCPPLQVMVSTVTDDRLLQVILLSAIFEKLST